MLTTPQRADVWARKDALTAKLGNGDDAVLKEAIEKCNTELIKEEYRPPVEEKEKTEKP